MFQHIFTQWCNGAESGKSMAFGGEYGIKITENKYQTEDVKIDEET